MNTNISLRQRLREFRSNTSGGVLIMFAGGAMALTLIAGGAIELHRRNLATTELQNASDAAALVGMKTMVAGKKTSGTNAAKAQGSSAAKKVFDDSISKSRNFATAPSANYKWNADGSFTVTTQPNFKVYFGTLLPSNFQKLNVRSTVDFSNSLPTEVALVLDTTASMFNMDGRLDTRFTLMRNAAKKFTHQMFNAAQNAGDVNLVRMSVVPWATSVNVLGGAPAAPDFTGDSPVTSMADKGSQVAVSSPMSRMGFVTGATAVDFAPVGWRGCVSGSNESAAIDDNKPASLAALLVPAAPLFQMPIVEGPITPTPVTVATCVSTVLVPCTPGVGTQGFNRLIERAIPQITSAAFLFDKGAGGSGAPIIDAQMCNSCVSYTSTVVVQNLPDCSGSTPRNVPYCSYYGDGGRRNSFIKVPTACTYEWSGCYETGKGPTANVIEPACIADPNEQAAINKTVPWCPAYYTSPSKDWNALVDNHAPEIAGPNINCPTPMLGLSGNRKQVIEYIDRLTPVPGGTHADVGLRWGLRTLSANNGWPAFFGLTKNPAAFGTSAQKVLVMITDGENEQAVQFPGYWGCDQIDGDHIGCAGSPKPAELDTKMQSWCDTIRTKNQVTIFAVAVNFANPGAVAKLQACAGDPANVFSVDAAGLNAVLDGIGSRVMAMRLVQ